jgi:hypothetical protein
MIIVKDKQIKESTITRNAITYLNDAIGDARKAVMTLDSVVGEYDDISGPILTCMSSLKEIVKKLEKRK